MSAVLARVAGGEPDLRAVDPRIEPLLYAALSPDPGGTARTTTRWWRLWSATPTVLR